MKKIITTSAYSNKTAQLSTATNHKRFFGEIYVEVFVPEIEAWEINPNAQPGDEAWSTAYQVANKKTQNMAEEALKRIAWQLKYEKVDISLDHELSDPQNQADIGNDPVEIDVQMSGHKITGSG